RRLPPGRAGAVSFLRGFEPMRVDPITRRAASALPALALAAVVLSAAGCSTKPLKPVVVPPLSRVVLTPVNDSLAVGDGRLFVATAYDTNDVAVSGVGFNWSSTDPNVCSVSPNGFATAVGEGNAQIIAALGGKSDTSFVFAFTQNAWYEQTS